jgi:hypothetical protein
MYLPLSLKYVPGKALINGNFETGSFLPGWEDSGVLPRDVVSGEGYQTGRYAALLGSPSYNSAGGCPVGEGAIYQLVDIPSWGHSSLRLWYRICSYDTVEFDYFAVYIAGTPRGPLDRAFFDGRIVWDTTIWCSPWKEAVIPLDVYKGHTILLKLSNAMTNTDGWYNTWTYVDDAQIETRW